MSWRRNLRRASFRGITFFVESVEGSGGRRLAVHEYPERDEPLAQDLGRKARSFQLEAYVLGQDYMAARDALIDALDKKGPGELIHPYRGAMQVAADVYTYTESSREGGMAIFRIPFVEAGKNTYPNSSFDTRAMVDRRAGGSILASQSVFERLFDVSGRPAYVSQGGASTLTSAVHRVQSLSSGGSASFSRQSGSMLTNALSLLVDPRSLGGQLVSLISSLSGMGTPSRSQRSLRPLSSFGSDLPYVPRTTPSRIAQANNQDAMTALVRRVALSEEARSSARMNFATYDDAAAMRRDLGDRLDVEMDMMTDDTEYAAYADLRAATVRDLTVRGADLSRVTTVPVRATTPSLVMAYNLYEDAGRSDEIVSRNRIRHPGFVPGGKDLEVLSDD